MKKTEKQNKKKRTSRRIKKFILLFILIGIIIFDSQVYENGGGVKGFLSTIFGKGSVALENLDTIYVLVMGVSDDLEKELTDTIILCGYNPKQQKASMLSIPRDTFVGDSKANAKGSDKINSLYSTSPQKTLDAVSEITGIDVEYYAVINTQALIETVDIIGGVYFDVPIDMSYDDETQDLHIHLSKGYQKIDGEKAEQLLRFRHSNPDKNGVMTTYPSEYGSDDYGRMKTQREFMIATVQQALQTTSISKMKDIITTVFENLDTNLTLDMVSPYAPYVMDFDVANIESLQLPGVSDKLNNLWFFVHDEEETIKLVDEMKNKLDGIEPVEEGNTIQENATDSNLTNSQNTQ